MSEEIKNTENTEEKQETTSDETQNTEQKQKEINNRIPYERFKEKVDEVNELKKKLAEFEKAQEEAEKQKLEEQEKYKELYEKEKEKAEKAKQEALQIKKQTALLQVGYSSDQAELLVKLVEGETDEKIEESIKHLQATIPVEDEYGDPSPMNSERDKPEAVGADEVGSKVFERIKGKLF